MSGEKLRQRLLYYLATKGVKQTWISDSTAIPSSILSAFKRGKISLNDESEKALHKFLCNEGF